MIRIKLPMGGITPEQMDTFADVIEEFAPLNKGHITTRQNVQIHHVPLPDAAELIRRISDSGLSSREGCGNTVRNVTGDPWAGVTPGELFDITPYAGAYVRYFVRHPTTQLMPRKVKTAFTATDEDRAITGIHDIAFIPRERARRARGAGPSPDRSDVVRGVEIRVGGGTSIMPRVAPTLYEFVELDNGDYLKVSEAVFRIFDRQDWLRVNRARARIKVLIDKIGIDAFREQVEEELEGDWVTERDFDPTGLLFEHDEEAGAPAGATHYAQPNGDGSAFERFRASNVESQRQAGFSTVQVRVIRGDLTPEQFRGLARIMRDYSGGYARTTVEQNLLLRWVRDESVYEVWRALDQLGLGAAGAGQIVDTVSCPGTDSCKLGITSSMGLNRAVMDRVEALEIADPLTKRIHIKMSGCPNGCSQHHIANIGFYGASIKVGEHTVPAYVAHIGGRYEGGEVVYGSRLKVRLAAKRVPEAVERWLRMYESEREEGEEFNSFAERVGGTRFEDEVRDLGMAIEFSLENMNHFIDWQRKEPFQVVRGEGECAI
jgi:sulfite reductase (ferredoxin)